MDSKILLIEGIPGIGKSTLIHALMRKHMNENEKIRTFLHLTQAHTYGPLAVDEDNNCLTKEKSINHLDKIISMLEWFSHSVAEEKLSKFYALIDTLHFTHCFRPGTLTWEDAIQADMSLSEMKCKVIFLRGSREVVWQRSILSRKDTQFINGYAKKFGSNIDEVYSYFLQEQNNMELLISKSSMNKLIIDNNGNLDDIIKMAYDFWIN